MTEEKKPRIVELWPDVPPEIRPDTPENRLEEMLKMANLLGPDNNQNGNGKKNPSKAVRAERRNKKLARKKNRYR